MTASAREIRPDRTALSDADFNRVVALMRDRCGIQIRDGREMLVQSRLTPRVAELELETIADYLALAASDGRELSHLVDLLTTNKTGFFRERQHFDFLRTHVLPQLDGSRPFRIWSAGCSTGEEPYSLSMLWRDEAPRGCPAPAILATDLSIRALDRARDACYTSEMLEGLDAGQRARHLEPVPGAAGRFALAEPVRAPVTFARLNLMDRWPMRGPFDLILCRNVMIYFSRDTQMRLADRFASLLRPGCHLLIGHAESLTGTTAPLEFIQPATYRRTDTPTPAQDGSANSEGRRR